MNEKELEIEQKKLKQERDDFQEQMKSFKDERAKFDTERRQELAQMEKEKQQMQDRLEPTVTKTNIDINLGKSVMARMRGRIKEILKLSQAKNEKILRGNIPHWITTPPNMHISRLTASVNNGVAKISYYIFEKDKNGNKVLQEHKSMVKQADGTNKEVVLSANHVIGKLMVETIKYREPMTTEEYKEND